MITDITHIGCTQQGIANGVNQHIGITMAEQTQLIIYLDTTQPQVTVLYQLVNIVSKSYTYIHNLIFIIKVINMFIFCPAYRLNRSFNPSISNASVKRRVWSSGLLLAVATT